MELWSHGKSINATKHTTDAPKVKLEVYFEALCPGCQDFTTGEQFLSFVHTHAHMPLSNKVNNFIMI